MSKARRGRVKRVFVVVGLVGHRGRAKSYLIDFLTQDRKESKMNIDNDVDVCCFPVWRKCDRPFIGCARPRSSSPYSPNLSVQTRSLDCRVVTAGDTASRNSVACLTSSAFQRPLQHQNESLCCVGKLYVQDKPVSRHQYYSGLRTQQSTWSWPATARHHASAVG